MLFEDTLRAGIRSIAKQDRDQQQEALLDLLTQPSTVRLDLNDVCELYNRRASRRPWKRLREVAPDCTPLAPGVWAEWTDGALDNLLVGCAITVVAHRPDFDWLGADRVPRAKWLVMAYAVTRNHEGYVAFPDLQILLGLKENGEPFSDVEYIGDLQKGNPYVKDAVIGIFATAMMGISCVHTYGTRTMPDGAHQVATDSHA